MARAASCGEACARIWWRPAEGVSLGRFHRRAPDADPTLERRASGGRAVPTGPGLPAVTLVLPEVGWLQPAGPALRPDQVLNRSLRPLLAMLRGVGVDVFYPGRDLVTIEGRPVAHASFTLAPDGVCTAEIHCAFTQSLDSLGRLLPRLDPDGVAQVDAASLSGGATLADVGILPEPALWADVLEEPLSREFGCEVVTGPPFTGTEAAFFAGVSEAFRGFQRERGPMPGGCASAAAIGLLGAVEACARLEEGFIRDLEISGDLIAPFHTLEEVAGVCEGQNLRPAALRRCLLTVMSKPRNFALGFDELDELIARVA